MLYFSISCWSTNYIKLELFEYSICLYIYIFADYFVLSAAVLSTALRSYVRSWGRLSANYTSLLYTRDHG